MTRTFESALAHERTVGDPSSPFGGGSTRSAYLKPDGEPDFAALQGSAEFRALRSRLRRFVFPMTAVFILWYMAYVLFAAYAHTFMSKKVFGEINVGLIFGLLQFVSTILITVLYVRYARNKIDPAVDEVRELAGVPKQ
jgi:uncharacterized membrane protein (DUF485 family)